MIVDISFERIEGAHFIFGAVYGSSTFKTVSVFSIFGLVWQTKVVTSSSWVCVMATCYEPCVANQKKKKKRVSINRQYEVEEHISQTHHERSLTKNCGRYVIKRFAGNKYALNSKYA